MQSQLVVVGFKHGITGLAATQLTQLATSYPKTKIIIARGYREADAKNLFRLLSLAIEKKGEKITIIVNGRDELIAMGTISNFLVKGEFFK